MTVIARAPLRIGLAGGGTDLPAYADRFEGLVLSTTIDRYVYVIVTKEPNDVLQITSADASSFLSRREHLFDNALFWGADYQLPMKILDYYGISGGRRIFIASEVPPGTGLGSSSATAVALITALNLDQSRSMTRVEVAELACYIEIDLMGMPIGRQDQYAAAFGGLNVLRFSRGGTRINPCTIDESAYRELDNYILLFFTGRRRRSTDILKRQRDATGKERSETLTALHEIKCIAEEMISTLHAGDIESVGRLLDESWQLKRRLAPGVTTSEIDEWYAEARVAGALGGKITGAGGGGFLMLFAPPIRHRAIIERLSQRGLVWCDTSFERQGVAPILSADEPVLIPAD